MKKVKIGIQTLQTLLICVALSLICDGCDAKVLQKKVSMYEAIDSAMRSEIGDSLCSIMLNARRIEVERINLINDSIVVLSSKKMNATNTAITKFLFASYENYSDAGKAFGKFSPNIRLKFSKRRKSCYAYFDFSLQILVIKNANDEELKRCVLANRDFLKLANLLFPADEFLTFILNNK